MEGFMIRGWDPILLRCGGTSALVRGETLAARSLYEGSSQSTISGWRWGFHIVQRGIDPGDRCFRPRVVGVVHVWKEF